MRLIDADKLHELLGKETKLITRIEDNRDMFYHDSGYNCAMVGARILVENQPAIEAASEMNWKRNGFNDFIRAMKEAYPTSKSGYTEFDVYFRDVMSRFTASDEVVAWKHIAPYQPKEEKK